MDCKAIEMEVQADGPGCLLVRWRLEPQGAVDIALGPTPAVDGHTVVRRAAVGTEVARLRGLRPGRHYVSLRPCSGTAPLVAAERRVRFDGVRNFRDLGGYPTLQGRRVRWGLLFRSDALHGMTEGDLSLLATLGLRSVYDLRSDAERSENPDPMESIALEVVHLGPGEEAVGVGNVASRLDAERVFSDVYIGMLAHSGPRFGELFATLSRPGGVPAAFHSAAGKDRTGMMAALLLSALGVDRSLVLDDYELTARWRRLEEDQDVYRAIVEEGFPEEAAVGFLGAPRWAMSDALRAVDERYGGIDAYLCGPAGMDAKALEDLRSALTL